MTLKRWIIIALAIGAFAGGVWLLKKPATEPLNDVFVVGTTAGYAPFVSINLQGEYEGFDIDVARAVADRMGKKLVIKDLGAMAPLFMALENGSIDAIIWALSITQQRLQKVAMVRYQGELTSAYSLIFWQKVPQSVSSINDMGGKTVCVEPASAQETVLRSYPAIIPFQTEKVDDALLNIQYGKADAALVEPAIARKFKAKYPEIIIMDVPLSVEHQVMGMGITIKKENAPLIKEVERVVESLRADGTLKQLETKWGVE